MMKGTAMHDSSISIRAWLLECWRQMYVRATKHTYSTKCRSNIARVSVWMRKSIGWLEFAVYFCHTKPPQRQENNETFVCHFIIHRRQTLHTVHQCKHLMGWCSHTAAEYILRISTHITQTRDTLFNVCLSARETGHGVDREHTNARQQTEHKISIPPKECL